MKKNQKSGLKNRALKQTAILIIVTMVILVTAFYITFYYRTIKEQSSYEKENLANVETYLTNYFEEVDSIAKNVNYDYYLQNYLEAAIKTERRYTEPSVGKNMRAYEMSSQAFSDTLLSRPDISSIMIFGRQKVLLYKSLYSYRNVVMDYSGLDWYAKALENPSKAAVTGPNQHKFFDTEDETISLSREVQSYEDGSFRGVVLINLNMNKLAEICESFQEGTEGFFCMVNEDGELIYQQRSGKDTLRLDVGSILDKLNEQIKENSQDSFRLKVYKKEYLVTRRQMQDTGWYLINIVPYASVLSGITYTSVMMVLAVAVTLLATLILLNRILTNVVRPLKRLEKNMNRVNLENMNQKVPVETDDEIGHLSTNFNQMLERIENLKEQVVEEQEDKRKYELQALQAQINPHFLYNTLDSIIWMAETNDSNIVAMTEALAKLFRISLNKGNEEILLKKEIEHVKNYLIIQSMRYADKFTYEILVDSEVEKCGVIKLILQPIVENCIYHGIKKKRGTGHIEIKAFREDENLIIKISDDGCGMTEEMCRKMLSDEIEPENISGSGIGVKNVNERIHLRFGEEYGLSYWSEEGKGTTVTYVLPFQVKEISDEKK